MRSPAAAPRLPSTRLLTRGDLDSNLVRPRRHPDIDRGRLSLCSSEGRIGGNGSNLTISNGSRRPRISSARDFEAWHGSPPDVRQAPAPAMMRRCCPASHPGDVGLFVARPPRIWDPRSAAQLQSNGITRLSLADISAEKVTQSSPRASRSIPSQLRFRSSCFIVQIESSGRGRVPARQRQALLHRGRRALSGIAVEQVRIDLA